MTDAGPMRSLAKRWHRGVRSVAGPLLFIDTPPDAYYGATMAIQVGSGARLAGQIVELGDDHTVVQILGESTGIDVATTMVSLDRHGTRLAVTKRLLGRTFDGAGRAADGLPAPSGGASRSVNGAPLNPVARRPPDRPLQTGVSAIDGLNTLVRGQKLPVFSGAGLPAYELVSLLVHSLARLAGDDGEPTAVVFCGIGITHREADLYLEALAQSGLREHLVSYLNRAGDPVAERLLAPRCALTAAEHLAFDAGLHVLVVLVDMANYCDALRQIAAAREEVPGRRGYPGYMYTDLAAIYERAGCVHGATGTVTQIPVLTVPDDDLTHPIADLTGYITEGQLVLSRELHRRGVFPPIDVLPSLSRLMNRGIGDGKTRYDHRGWADQLYAVYARGRDLRRLAAIVGEDALSEQEKTYLRLADRFEHELVHQGDDARSIADTMAIGWQLLQELDAAQLTRVGERALNEFHVPQGEE